MDREQGSVDDIFLRAAVEYWLGQQAGQAAPSAPETQRIPVNVFETDEDVVIVAPMPGVEADNIDVEVAGSTVTLRSSLRGPGQAGRRYLVHEWTYGPYERTISLPVDVDAERANASHGNGVFVLTLPKGSRSKAVQISLGQSSEIGRGGHSGHHTPRQSLE